MDPFEPEQGGDAIEQGIEFERLGQEIVMRVIFAMAALEIMDVGGDHQDHRIVAMLLPDGPRGIPAVTAGHGDVEHHQVGKLRAADGQTSLAIVGEDQVEAERCQDVRSEEHTSELQSLMRSSY